MERSPRASSAFGLHLSSEHSGQEGRVSYLRIDIDGRTSIREGSSSGTHLYWRCYEPPYTVSGRIHYGDGFVDGYWRPSFNLFNLRDNREGSCGRADKMQGFGLIKRGPVQISWGQPYPRSEVLEPNHLDGNRILARLGIVDGCWTVHEPPVISSITVQGRRCPTGRVVAEQPHIRSVGIELRLDVRGKIVTSIDNHPDVLWVQPTPYDEILETLIQDYR